MGGRDVSWIAWVGLAGVIGLGWFAFNHGSLQPQRLASDVESNASLMLSKAGFGWARLDVHGKVGELQGEAPSEDARVAAYDAARRLLAPYMGVPGVFSELDNRVRVKVPVPEVRALASVSGAEHMAKVPASQGGPSRECLDALNSAMKGAPIRFKPRSTELPATARPAIRRMVQVVKRCERWRLVVEGYPDAGVPDPVNRRLVQKRALSVAAALLLEGVPVAQLALQTEDGRLKTPGSEEAPTAKSARRVEFHLLPLAATNG